MPRLPLNLGLCDPPATTGAADRLTIGASSTSWQFADGGTSMPEARRRHQRQHQLRECLVQATASVRTDAGLASRGGRWWHDQEQAAMCASPPVFLRAPSGEGRPPYPHGRLPHPPGCAHRCKLV